MSRCLVESYLPCCFRELSLQSPLQWELISLNIVLVHYTTSPDPEALLEFDVEVFVFVCRSVDEVRILTV